MCTRRKRKAVVLALRGTMSMADIVTDAVAHPEQIDDWLPPRFAKVLIKPATSLLGDMLDALSRKCPALHTLRMRRQRLMHWARMDLPDTSCRSSKPDVRRRQTRIRGELLATLALWLRHLRCLLTWRRSAS